MGRKPLSLLFLFNGSSLIRAKTNFYNHCIYYGLRLVCHFFFELALNFLGKMASGIITEIALKSLWEKCRGFG
ncbi:MAG: hypothetical protein D6785_06510, partial [Planctomycetota bacterium]